jgi:hypothetical protein
MSKAKENIDKNRLRSFRKIGFVPLLAVVSLGGSMAYAAGPTPPPVPASGVLTAAPNISVLVVPSPQTLAATGSVTYTYTVKNVEPTFVPMTGVTVTDDKCATVMYVSGDTNTNVTLDATEVWTYTCTNAAVAATTTSTVTATGHAGTLVAVDTAFATVTVGATAVPAPMIQVIKHARMPVLPAGGGLEMYGYSVTNPGAVALAGITISDDKCSPITAAFGDTNNNNGIPINALLNPNESWEFACITVSVPVNTVDTVTATGTGNGLTATDYAYATVIVTPGAAPTPTPTPVTPALPSTGIGNDAPSTPWNLIAIPIGLGAAWLLLYTVRRKQSI